MGRPDLDDHERNVDYYRTNTAYEDNRSRLVEPRVQWAANWCKRALSVIDLGCNDGFFSDLLGPDVKYLGVEANPVAASHPYPSAKGRIVQMDVLNPHLEMLGHYDRVVVMEILEHLVGDGPLVLLTRARRLLNPHGILVSTSASRPSFVDPKHHPGNHEHVREWSLPEFADLHRQAGYSIVESVLREVYPGRFTNCVAATPVPIDERNDERRVGA